MKTIIVYKSKYGSSGQYAGWLAETLACEAIDVSAVKLNQLLGYDTLIYIGGLYAGSVDGFKRFSKHLDALRDKRIVLCMVGMTSPANQERYEQMFLRNVPERYRSSIKPFALQGDLLFSKMSGIHRIMMNVPKAMTEKIPVDQRTDDDRRLLESFGKDAHFANRDNLDDIVQYVKGLI